MFFTRSKTAFDSGYGMLDENGFVTSFNGTVIDGVEKIDENILIDDLCISGSAIFTGEVDADRIVVPGRAEFREFLTCDDLNVAGEALAKESVVCESIVVGGEMKTMGKVITDVLVIGGRMHSNRKIKTINLNVDGEFECSNKLFTDKAVINGVLVYVSELKSFDLKFKSPLQSKAGRIVTDMLVAINRDKEKNEFVLCCDVAECGVAKLEYVKIDELKCERCKIGPGCVIGRLEYSESAEISEDAVVGSLICSASEVH